MVLQDEVTEHKKNRNQECLDLVDAYLQVIEMEKHDPSSPFDGILIIFTCNCAGSQDLSIYKQIYVSCRTAISSTYQGSLQRWS